LEIRAKDSTPPGQPEAGRVKSGAGGMSLEFPLLPEAEIPKFSQTAGAVRMDRGGRLGAAGSPGVGRRRSTG
jgi:hypothetical protein